MHTARALEAYSCTERTMPTEPMDSDMEQKVQGVTGSPRVITDSKSFVRTKSQLRKLNM